MLWCAPKARPRRKYADGEEIPGYIYLGAFLCGLAFGAHQSMVLLVPSYAWLVLSADWRMIRRIKEQIFAGIFFVLGFSVYLYLPIRASRDPLLNWGDPQTLTQFSWHFLRKGYPSEKVSRDMALLWKQLSAFNIVHEFTVVGLALLVTGLLAYLFVRRDEVIAFLIGVFVFLAVLAVHPARPLVGRDPLPGQEQLGVDRLGDRVAEADQPLRLAARVLGEGG